MKYIWSVTRSCQCKCIRTALQYKFIIVDCRATETGLWCWCKENYPLHPTCSAASHWTGLDWRHPGMCRESGAVPLRATGMQVYLSTTPQQTIWVPTAHLCSSWRCDCCPGPPPTAFQPLAHTPTACWGFTCQTGECAAVVRQVLTGILFPSQKSKACGIPPSFSHSRPCLCFHRNAMDRKNRDTPHTSCLCLSTTCQVTTWAVKLGDVWNFRYKTN